MYLNTMSIHFLLSLFVTSGPKLNVLVLVAVKEESVNWKWSDDFVCFMVGTEAMAVPVYYHGLFSAS